jgi:hypothetical protein
MIVYINYTSSTNNYNNNNNNNNNNKECRISMPVLKYIRISKPGKTLSKLRSGS